MKGRLRLGLWGFGAFRHAYADTLIFIYLFIFNYLYSEYNPAARTRSWLRTRGGGRRRSRRRRRPGRPPCGPARASCRQAWGSPRSFRHLLLLLFFSGAAAVRASESELQAGPLFFLIFPQIVFSPRSFCQSFLPLNPSFIVSLEMTFNF